MVRRFTAKRGLWEAVQGYRVNVNVTRHSKLDLESSKPTDAVASIAKRNALRQDAAASDYLLDSKSSLE